VDVKRIWVIYADSGSRRLLDQILIPAGYDVVAIAYGSVAITDALSIIKPGVVLIDIGFAAEPVRDLCRRIRKESHHVPLFVLGSGERAKGISLLDLGPEDYIRKPIDETEFLARVHARFRWWAADGR
jgi:DNA-binding response OmpR family regulator